MKNKKLEESVPKTNLRILQNEERIDDLEQYSRTNSVRISGIPEEEEENTDRIAICIARAIGAKVELQDICRSHRVGNLNINNNNNDNNNENEGNEGNTEDNITDSEQPTSANPRNIIVKFVSFKIIHINCQSLSEDKKPLLESVSNQYDIITCSETWFRDDFPDSRTHLSGFHKPVMRNRVAGWGGVCIYVRSDLYYKSRPDLDIENLESVWIETQINRKIFDRIVL